MLAITNPYFPMKRDGDKVKVVNIFATLLVKTILSVLIIMNRFKHSFIEEEHSDRLIKGLETKIME